MEIFGCPNWHCTASGNGIGHGIRSGATRPELCVAVPNGQLNRTVSERAITPNFIKKKKQREQTNIERMGK